MKIGRIILTVLGIALLALGIKGLMDIPGQQAILDAAVYLDEPVVLPENEGKLVIIHGVPEMTAPIDDKGIGLTVNAIKAIRYAEEYRMVSKEELVETYNWVSRGSQEMTGEATLGSFVLDEKILSVFAADKDYDAFDAAELSTNGYSTGYGRTADGARTNRLWVIVGGAYYYDPFEYNTSHDIPHIQREVDKGIVDERKGSMAFSYRVFSADSDTELTIVGIQQGNRLMADETIGAIVRSGVLSKAQVLSSNKGGIIGGAVVFMVLGAALVFLGVRKPRIKAKEACGNQLTQGGIV